MSRHRNEAESALLDPETWEVPSCLTDDDLYHQAGADRRVYGHPADDQEDDR